MSGPGLDRVVAIVGLALRLPRANSLDEFWRHLEKGDSLITEVPAERWSKERYFGDPRREANRTSSIWGGFIEDADCFDAEFFGISPREAQLMDPQQRFALELSWKAIEDAGYRPGSFAGRRIGVYMGVCHWDYAEMMERDLREVDAYVPTGIAYSIISNRVSYFLDLRGPSITNDTACAASLVSVYEAVRAIQCGECDAALAGGVNLCWSPNHFIAFSKAGMLSKEGRSKVFDSGADGYVRGEGGAVLFLKPLDRAVEDGDPIHAVIREIGTNHGGKTSSLTVTNPKAQADLITEVYERAGVPPESISYIETHGTGTPLGDPVEILGLKMAFERLHRGEGSLSRPATCGLGSVKTNIGHLEGAAGVAGIAKVIAAFAHRTIPANLHFRELNPMIALEGSPFYIADRARPWEKGAHPRRAGVSSFGFGGSNAHALLEEFVAAETPVVETAGPYLVPLSARNPERLADQARALLRFVVDARDPLDLASLAWTLQAGREAFEERWVALVSDRSDLVAKLGSLLEERSDVPGCWRGNLEAGRRVVDFIVSDEDSRGLVETWFERRNAARLAELWVQGYPLEWERWYGDRRPRRMRLPTYPFARERHWIPSTRDAVAAEDAGSRRVAVVRTDGGPRARRIRFSGEEFFLTDHRVGGRNILPGAVSLELARAALAEEMGQKKIRLENVAWVRPLQIERQIPEIEIVLTPKERGRLGYEVSSFSESGERIALSIGDGVVVSDSGNPPAPRLDLERLRRNVSRELSGESCYAILDELGFHYGPGHRSLASLGFGFEVALAQLELPPILWERAGDHVLHPSLIDGAFQAAVIFLETLDPGRGRSVPFALESLRVFGSTPGRIAARIGLSNGSSLRDPVMKLEIHLCGTAGEVLVEMRGMTWRVSEERARPTPSGIAAKHHRELIFATTRWELAPWSGAAACPSRVFLLVEGARESISSTLTSMLGTRVEVLDASESSATVRANFGRVFEALQALVQSRPRSAARLIVLVPSGRELLAAPYGGLFKSARKENPMVGGTVVVVEPEWIEDSVRIAEIIRNEAGSADQDVEIRYPAGGGREARRNVELERSGSVSPVFKPAGVYWITGGAGGLGRIFRNVARKAGATVVLSGRSEINDARHTELGRDGAAYIRADASLFADVKRTVDEILAKYGRLDGLIHAAGVLRDSYILKKTTEEIDAVLPPKIDAALNIDEATKNIPLDFFVLFSSIAGLFGNAGQSDYASANAFLDAFAAHRQILVERGARQGRTLSINWPLWEEGGMTVDPVYVEAVRRETGLEPLPAEVGLRAFEEALCLANPSHLCPAFGDARRFRRYLGSLPEARSETVAVAAGMPPEKWLKTRTIAYLKETVADVIRMDASRIKSDQKLEKYGLDSISIVEITSRLEKQFGSLSKTLFFEYVTLAEVAKYFLDEHRERIASLFTPSSREGESERMEADAFRSGPALSERGPDLIDLPRRAFSGSTGRSRSRKIAIIGLSGRYPKSENLAEFWKNLEEGRDCLEPVPKDRWDHARIYSSDRDDLGKSTIRNGSFLRDIDKFDPRYFSITKRQAELMSPEVRILLECGVEAIEDAGYSREYIRRRYDGDVGVLVGTMSNHYNLYGFQNNLLRGAPASGSYTGTLANMLSYFYGFTGPSIFLDTMCSGSSTCLHEGVEMLRARRCAMVLVGSVNLMLHPYNLVSSSQEHFTTATSDTVRSYGIGADGTILGEGAGAVLLKPLEDAERDGDHIYGVIIGTAITNAGVRNGFTVPTPKMQAAAIERAIEDAGIDPRTISYFEGHGSGTALGDPIEIKAATEAYRKFTRDRQFCPIGSVKSNIAHLLHAAGLAGLTKVLLQMQHATIVPSLHSDVLNEAIDFEASPFRVHREREEWRRPSVTIDGRFETYPRRAGITSIGAGGMNSHIIVEEYDNTPIPERASVPQIFVFSAMTPETLQIHLERVRRLIVAESPDTGSLAYTLQTGKNELPCRLAFVATSKEDFIAAIDDYLSGRVNPAIRFVKSVFDADPDIDDEDVDRALRDRELERIRDYWAMGMAIDWDRLVGPVRPRRISLPPYPFERIRCWYPEHPAAPTIFDPLVQSPARLSNADAALSWSPSARTPLDAVPVENTAMVSVIREHVASLAGFAVTEVDEVTHFHSFGFDSIALSRLANTINENLGSSLTPAVFFECENIAALAGYIAARQSGSAVAARLAHPKVPIIDSGIAEESPGLAIAIVGAAGRFPGAGNLEEFWGLLADGVDLVGRYPFSRHHGEYRRRFEAADFPQFAGTLEDIDRFDAKFFKIVPRQAELMDPQHRLALEVAWETIECGGYAPANLPHDTGVYFGVTGTDYATLLAAHDVPIDAFTSSGNVHSMLANRISFVLDVHGPSEAIDTACSSSLVALHRAVESLRSGRCSMALAGGVNLLLAHDTFVGAHLAGMLSSDGKCKAFSSDADGYVRGEGVAAVLLKPLAAAERDGDTILGVIIGSAENHGGRASSLTAPNARAQAELVEQAMRGIDPRTISYIETHGTGTELGDPVEINALKIAYGNLVKRTRAGEGEFRCALGSVKTNIGHLEAAAGIASVVKVLLALEHGEIPANLHCGEINPYITLDDSPFEIVRQRRAWTAPHGRDGRRKPRRAGVSSFGFGGSNAHVVIEEYLDGSTAASSSAEQLFVLSALDEPTIRLMAARLASHISTRPGLSPAAVAFTLQTGRMAHRRRLAVVAPTLDLLRTELQNFAEGREGNFVNGVAGAFDGVVPAGSDLRAVARAWVEGAEFDWRMFHGARPPGRVPLPTYPFARDRHWFTPPDALTSELARELVSGTDGTLAARLLDDVLADRIGIAEAIRIAGAPETLQ